MSLRVAFTMGAGMKGSSMEAQPAISRASSREGALDNSRGKQGRLASNIENAMVLDFIDGF